MGDKELSVEPKVKLFVYGIFLEERVRRNAFGGDVHHELAALRGYRISDRKVNGLYKTIEEAPDDFVEGMLLEIPEESLVTTDLIEGVQHGLYERIKVGEWFVYIHRFKSCDGCAGGCEL